MKQILTYSTEELAVSMKIVRFLKKVRPLSVYYPHIEPLWHNAFRLWGDLNTGQLNVESASNVLDAFEKDLENSIQNL